MPTMSSTHPTPASEVIVLARPGLPSLATAGATSDAFLPYLPIAHPCLVHGPIPATDKALETIGTMWIVPRHSWPPMQRLTLRHPPVHRCS